MPHCSVARDRVEPDAARAPAPRARGRWGSPPPAPPAPPAATNSPARFANCGLSIHTLIAPGMWPCAVLLRGAHVEHRRRPCRWPRAPAPPTGAAAAAAGSAWARLRAMIRSKLGGLGGRPVIRRRTKSSTPLGLQGRVEAPLEADRGRGLARHGPPAARPGPVRGIDLHAVGQAEQALGEARVEVGRGLLAAEVRAAHVAHEKRVAGQHEPRLGAAAEIGHQQRDALGGVAGRVHDVERDAAHLETPSVLDRLVGEGRAGGGMDVDARPGLGREGLVARDVVGVDVGLHDAGDR